MITFIRNQRRVLKYSNSCQTLRKYSKYVTPHYRSNISLQHRLDSGGAICWTDCASLTHRSLNLSSGIPALTAAHGTIPLTPLYSYNAVREFRLNQMLCESPSSKVEVTVQSMKDKQKEKVEEIIKEAVGGTAPAAGAAASTIDAKQVTAAKPAEAKVVTVKKPLKTRIWEELVHYYHGFRLLFIDINVCMKLVWQVLNGKTLTRRENRLLVRTTSDLFRLIPFSVFVIVPFMELLLPVFIKFFPGMLPSTFQTAKEQQDKLKQSLQVKLDMAKFLQKTLDEMALQHKDHKSEEARQFADFFKKIRESNEPMPNENIIKFAKRFDDEITLDSLNRDQLIALCRVLEQNTMGTTTFLRFQLRVKMRSLAADDRVIAREGVGSLDLMELQQACKARGMRAYGLTEERLRYQLQEWIDLSVNEKVSPTLLLLSRAVVISDDLSTTNKLKETIRGLPDTIAAQTKVAIGEREGKIDNKTKIEVIKQEELRIKEELEEEREEAKAQAKKEILVDKAMASIVQPPKIVIDPVTNCPVAVPQPVKLPDDKGISTKDVELLGQALKTLSSDKKKLVVEKEKIKELKEELEDYKEDLEELREVRDVVKEPVRERRAAKMLFKKVNNMIGQLDKVLGDLDKKHHQLQSINANATPEQMAQARRDQELIHIDELIQTIKKIQQTSDESRYQQIENVLSKIDADKDGVISAEEVLKVVEAISRDNVNLNEKQVEELITLLDKEQLIQAEEKIEKALAKSMKEAQMIEAKKLEEAKRKTEDLIDTALEIKDSSKEVMDETQEEIRAQKLGTTSEGVREAVEKQKEKIIPKTDISSAMPPTLPTPPPPSSTSTTQGNPKDKML